MKHPLRHLALAAALATAGAGALAADILVGQTAGFTGPVSQSVKEVTDGARLYIDAVNELGGVNGNQIKLVSLDDKFDPKIAAQNAARLIADGAVALFLTRGTPHTQALLPLAHEHGIPIIAPSTGAMVFHKPVDKLVFNVRAPYQRESERAVSHLLSMGMRKVAVIHVDDSFGADGFVGAQAAFDKAGLKPAFVAKFNREKPELADAVKQVQATEPQAVLVIGTADLVLKTAHALAATGLHCQLVTLSNNSASSFSVAIAGIAPGTIISQVFPNERTMSIRMMTDATALLAKKSPGAALSAANVEGYAAAEVLVEGLRRAGREPTPASIVSGLNSLSHFDLGGMEINYSLTNHSGSQFTDLAFVRADGSMVR